MITMMAKDLNIKDTLLMKDNVEFKDFKSKLDIYEYRNNYDFEGNLIQQSFIENYEYLITANEDLKNLEFDTRQQLSTANHNLENFVSQRNSMKLALNDFTKLKDDLIDVKETFVKDSSRLVKAIKDLNNIAKKNLKLLENFKMNVPSDKLAEIISEDVRNKTNIKFDDSSIEVVEKLLNLIGKTEDVNTKLNYFISSRKIADHEKASKPLTSHKKNARNSVIQNTPVLRFNQKVDASDSYQSKVSLDLTTPVQSNINGQRSLAINMMTADIGDDSLTDKCISSPGNTAAMMSPTANYRFVARDSSDEWSKTVVDEMMPALEHAESCADRLFATVVKTADLIAKLDRVGDN